MALINCPECGREVSDKAKACIHCGYPMTDAVKQLKVAPAAEPTVDDKKQEEITQLIILGDELRTEKSYLAALDCYRKAASLGSSHAQVWVGNIYDRGLGVEADSKEAVKWFQMAAEQDDVDALNNLALAYENGKGIEKSYTKAEAYYLKAIEMGNQTARKNYGIFANNRGVEYENGQGIEKDYAKAEAYYLKAIEMGSKTARTNYGVFANNRGVAYADGKGVEKNYAKAEAYYLKAIEYGCQNAKSNYDALKKTMFTPQSNVPSSTPPPSANRKVIGIILAILLVLVLWIVGATSDSSDKANTRTCPWCNGTGYSGNGADSAEDYVFKKTPCTHCGGDGVY